MSWRGFETVEVTAVALATDEVVDIRLAWCIKRGGGGSERVDESCDGHSKSSSGSSSSSDGETRQWAKTGIIAGDNEQEREWSICFAQRYQSGTHGVIPCARYRGHTMIALKCFYMRGFH